MLHVYYYALCRMLVLEKAHVVVSNLGVQGHVPLQVPGLLLL